MVIEKLILGVVQGITEFLPISSSGHLVLLKHIFGLEYKGAYYETFLHTATFFSVIAVLYREVFLWKNFKRYFPLSVIATLPLIPTVLLVKTIERTFENPKILPLTFLITSIILFITKFFPSKNKNPTVLTSLFMGLFQVISLFPGVSRSGITISAGIFVGLKMEEAFNLSFWMFLPASLGAFLIEFKDVGNFNLTSADVIVWFITFITGVISLYALKRILISRYFWIFSIYTLAISILSFLIF